MTKRTYRIEIDGQTFTRKSERTYTHAVVTLDTLAERLKRAEDSVRWDRKANRAYHEAYANGTSEFIPVPAYLQGHPESVARHQAKVEQQIEKSRAWLAQGLEADLAETAAQVTAAWRATHGDRDEAWALQGFNGSYELARKAAKNPTDRIVEVLA